MKFETFKTGPIETNTYLIYSERKAIVIDPGLNSAALLVKRAEQLNVEIKLIVNTHGHWDHITDNYTLRKLTKAKIACGKGDEEMLSNPSDLGFNLPFQVHASVANDLLNEGDEIKIAAESLRVIASPGHTPGSVCLYSKEDKWLFTGDTLFAGSRGRTDFPGGDEFLILESLKKLAELPGDTRVFPGHGDFTIIKNERKWILKE